MRNFFACVFATNADRKSDAIHDMFQHIRQHDNVPWPGRHRFRRVSLDEGQIGWVVAPPRLRQPSLIVVHAGDLRVRPSPRNRTCDCAVATTDVENTFPVGNVLNEEIVIVGQLVFGMFALAVNHCAFVHHVFQRVLQREQASQPLLGIPAARLQDEHAFQQQKPHPLRAAAAKRWQECSQISVPAPSYGLSHQRTKYRFMPRKPLRQIEMFDRALARRRRHNGPLS